jgi:hypothetical protein
MSRKKRLVFEGGLAPPTLKPASVGNHGDVLCSTISSALTGCQPIVKVYIFLSFSSSVPNLPDETKFDGEEREKKPSTRAPTIFIFFISHTLSHGKIKTCNIIKYIFSMRPHTCALQLKKVEKCVYFFEIFSFFDIFFSSFINAFLDIGEHPRLPPYLRQSRCLAGRPCIHVRASPPSSSEPGRVRVSADSFVPLLA